ncbi:MAG: leucine-rich repeat domain-containing protein [Saprospiraceae bacterium]|nr:leucine-rich repeat domain-containing protein [Saprospiraceae bacterium]
MQEANKYYSSQAGDEGYQEADRRISFFLSDEKETKLDLSGLNLRSIPGLLIHASIVDRLKEINLSANNIDDVKILSVLGKLQVLILSQNELSNLQPIQTLEELRHLDLAENKITSVTKMPGLSRLTYLNLRNNQISALEEQPQNELKFLDLSNNQLDNIEFIKGCPNLNELRLEGNRIKNIDSLALCKQLEILDLSRNLIMDLSTLNQCQKLKQLFLQGNSLTDLNPLMSLKSLIELNLSENSIKDIQMEHLTSLEVLLLNKNKIEKLDHLPSRLKVIEIRDNGLEEIGSDFTLDHIERIDVSDNKLSTFPFILGDKLATATNVQLHIRANPFLKSDKNINQEAYRSENGKEVFQVFISDYQINRSKALDKRIQVKLPAKLILLGNSDVGKTTLANFLIGKKVNPADIESTRILNIINWKIDRASQALIYDFGGQDFYHSAFRLFLSEDCVYIFVWTRNTNENRIQVETTKRPRPYHNYNLNYWLSNIQYLMISGNLRVGPALTNIEEIKVNTEIILLENKIDERPTVQSSTQFDEKILTVRDSFRLSLADDGQPSVLGLNDRKRLLKSALSGLAKNMSHSIELNQTREALISGYIKDYEQLSIRRKFKISDLYYTSEKFFEKYTGRSLSTQSDRGDLSAAFIILHNRGLLLKHPGERGGAWLAPNILIEKIKSFISTADKGVILRKKSEFLPFAELCSFHSFVVEKNELELIVPSLLPDSDDSILFRIANKGHTTLFQLKFGYFMPHGMINRIISGFGSKPSEKYFTKSIVIVDLQTMGNIFLKWDLVNLVIQVGLQLHKNADLERVTRFIYQNILAAYHGHQGVSWEKYTTYYNPDTGLIKSSSPSDINPDWETDSNDFTFWTQLFNDKVPKDLSVSIDDTTLDSHRFFVNVNEAFIQHQSGQYLIRGSSPDSNSDQYKIYKLHQFSPFLRHVVKQPKKVFLSYSHDDMRFKIELQKYLINLERQGLIEIWQDGLIQPGEEWDTKIRTNLEKADIVILLVSQNFIASNYIHETEFRTAMIRRAEQKATVLPVLLSDCDWQHWTVIPGIIQGDEHLNIDGRVPNDEKLSNLQFMPMNEGRLLPIIKWGAESDVWAKVVRQIRSIL